MIGDGKRRGYEFENEVIDSFDKKEFDLNKKEFNNISVTKCEKK